MKKKFKESFFCFLFGDKSSILSRQSITGIANLKLYTDNPMALQAVQKVEKHHALWMIAQLIAKIFVVTVFIYFTPTITALVPVATVATKLKVSFIAIAAIKNIALIDALLGVGIVWFYSYKGLSGISNIQFMETMGAF